MRNRQLNIRVGDNLLAALQAAANTRSVKLADLVRGALQKEIAVPCEADPDGRATAPNMPVRQIPLTRGMVALVDAEDFDRVSAYKWSCMNHGAAQARIGDTRVQMHRFILNLDKGDPRVVDHINHNRLDNRRCNLRIVTQGQNCANKTVAARKKGGYKGVIDQWNRRTPSSRRNGAGLRRFRAYVTKDGVTHQLGGFPTAELAAEAYDRKAHELYGEFALLNFPEKILEKDAPRG